MNSSDVVIIVGPHSFATFESVIDDLAACLVEAREDVIHVYRFVNTHDHLALSRWYVGFTGNGRGVRPAYVRRVLGWVDMRDKQKRHRESVRVE